ncbi:MAG: hypothetical protein ILO68_02905, partial [Clostridia bacterium]|nr:hypothetical protein [Clostridia bacterium]
MNKILHLILSIVLLLPVFLTEWPAGGMRAQAAGLSEQGDRSALSVLSFETKINESTDEVETVLILENTGWQTVSLFWKLPRISAGIRKGTLSLSSSGNVLRTSEDEVFLTFAARESIVLSYRYCAKNPLVHARVIAMDLRDLVFREDGRIGRFFISTELREEDLFLVKEVFPVNYTLEETTVSVELWNVKPSALLNRFYLSKETYRDLRGGREHEPNEEQLFVLDHYRDWLRDGLGLPENQSFQSNTVLFQTLMHPEQTLPSGGKLDAQYNRLREGTDAYLQLLHCICLREGRDLFGAPLWPLALEMERQKRFPEECHVIAIAYTSNPAVRDSLYYHPSDETEVLLKEEAVLTTEPKGFYSIKCSPNACAPYRIAEIGLGQTYDVETLQDYLDAIGAELFVKQMILDGRPLSPADYEKSALSGTNYAAVSSGNITAQDLIPLFSELSQVPSYMTLTVEDPLLSALDVPAFTHYLAVLTGDGLWFALHAGCYGTMFGAPFYAVVAASDAGQALLQPTLARRQATQNALRQRISAVPTAGLTETPFLENGDIGTLRVLELCLNIREETSVIRSEFRVKNDGPADILTCLTLPVLRNRIAADSFSVTDTDLGTPIAGGRIYGTIPAGGTLSVSYVYSTATPLLHSGAVGLDFAPLVFSPGGRIGHFSVSMELVPESIPLVTEISPVCYAFDGTTVSLDLWDFRPSALLNRFYLTKETYRGLRGSREYEPNEVERYVLENVRKWFRNGLPEIRDLDLPGTRDWAKLLVSEGFTSAYLLAEHSDTLAGVVTHLILTEKLRRGDLTPEAAALA